MVQNSWVQLAVDQTRMPLTNFVESIIRAAK
jgi:hypothetical protein